RMVSPCAPPLGPVFRVEEIAAKAISELVGVGALGKAENDHVVVVVTKRVCPCAQRQPVLVAEQADRYVVTAVAAVRWQGHVMWPLPIHPGFAELAFTIDHRRLRGGRRPRSTLLAAYGGRTRSRGGGRRQGSIPGPEQKGNNNSGWL